jgi:hypothetical protein
MRLFRRSPRITLTPQAVMALVALRRQEGLTVPQAVAEIAQVLTPAECSDVLAAYRAGELSGPAVLAAARAGYGYSPANMTSTACSAPRHCACGR